MSAATGKAVLKASRRGSLRRKRTGKSSRKEAERNGNYDIREAITGKDGDVLPRLELIKWQDHCVVSGSGWKKLDAVLNNTPIDIFSVGWVYKETDDAIWLVSHQDKTVALDGGSTIDGEMIIVKKAIVARHLLHDPSTPGYRKNHAP